MACIEPKQLEKKQALTFPSFFNLVNVAESPTASMILIAATGVYLFTEIIAFLDEKQTLKPASGFFNCNKQLDFRARAIKMRNTEILHEIKHKGFQLKEKTQQPSPQYY